MAQLCRFLPPFAGDYTGACSVLYGFDGLVVIVDAGCCTRNYVEYDENRWARRRRATFSAQLRTIDVVLGDDAKIADQTIEAAGELRPPCIALVGTPVPAIVGMDLPGIAREVEAACGIPAFGISTTGFGTYECGASQALDTVVRRFCKADSASCEAADTSALRVFGDDIAANVLGCTLQDFGTEDRMAGFSELLCAAGVAPILDTSRFCSRADVADAPHASASIVASWSGLAAARTLKDRYGVPFVVGRPGNAQEAMLMVREMRDATFRPLWEAIERAKGVGDWTRCTSKADGEAHLVTACGLEPVAGEDDGILPDGAFPTETRGPVLIVGEQVFANTIRARLRASGQARDREIVVASLFSMERSWMEKDDFALGGECDLAAFAREHESFSWIGDPLLARIPGFEQTCAWHVPHQAVSSSLFA